MAKHAAIKFDQKLQSLFQDRTHWLRAQVRKPGPGKPPTFNKKKVQRAIKKLQALATECQLRTYAIDGLGQLYDSKKQWHVTTNKGWGVEKKRKNFITWFQSRVPYKNCVYVFRAKRKCRYVGRTLRGKNRPRSHFKREWFPGVTRIDIYACVNTRNVPKLECLVTHRLRPTDSKIKPAARKWYAKCPICETHKRIRREVKAIFRLK